MDEFLEDLKSGEIQFRDRWQFELKSEFALRKGTSSYTQEFYFFIPNDLQITPETYSREDFYKDLTNLIRYKTPLIPLEQLCKEDVFAETESGLKLLGNIFRSSLRREIQNILNFSSPPEREIQILCKQIKQFRNHLEKHLASLDKLELKLTGKYLDEFIGNSIDYYLTGLLDQFQTHHTPLSNTIEEEVIQIIVEETKNQKRAHFLEIDQDEHILYRSSLLKKYFLDALQLRVDRMSVKEKYGGWISAFSTAIAMFVYLLLFIWQGQRFVINSLPFIIITVSAYVLKDRLKEWLNSFPYRQAPWYFYDYRTKILSPQEEVIGVLKESVSFVNEEQIPEDIRKIRNFEFHAMIKTFKRPEQIIYFKRTINTYPPKKELKLKSLNISLRYNLQDYLEKASDPHHIFTTLDPKTKTLLKIRLPKVYHLNVIMKNQFIDQENQVKIELKKFRIILNKNGIKNIEQIRA